MLYILSGHVALAAVAGSICHKMYSEKVLYFQQQERMGSLRAGGGAGVNLPPRRVDNVDRYTTVWTLNEFHSDSNSTAQDPPLPLTKLLSRRYEKFSEFTASFERSFQHLLGSLARRHPFLGPHVQTIGTVIRFSLPAILLMVVGSVVMGYLEGWYWSDAVYWCIITGTTIG